jgi:hypothetical protein
MMTPKPLPRDTSWLRLHPLSRWSCGFKTPLNLPFQIDLVLAVFQNAFAIQVHGWIEEHKVDMKRALALPSETDVVADRDMGGPEQKSLFIVPDRF